MLGVEGALALPVQERLAFAAGHQREVLQVLRGREEKPFFRAKTKPKPAKIRLQELYGLRKQGNRGRRGGRTRNWGSVAHIGPCRGKSCPRFWHQQRSTHGAVSRWWGAPSVPLPSLEGTHDVGAGRAEGVGAADVEVGLVQGHQHPDEIEALGLHGGERAERGGGAESPCSASPNSSPPSLGSPGRPAVFLTSWLFFLKAHSEVFSAVGPHVIWGGN